ncbi:Septum-promoting GTP-binding protein 1 [Sesamum angolense]|uniref:Septum-promoting GTP-binding protein 1 n=1 Tax=Sesamum angolense TaxID=2727404 RepID=A0AAE1WS46_9LAMI|nr:Septum-promoting GTP-binding protein 1 [Sesamum angolense]
MATQKFQDATGKMTQLCRRIVHINIRWSIVDKVTVVRRFFRLVWERLLVCSLRMPNNARYRRLSTRRNSYSSSSSTETRDSDCGNGADLETTTSSSGYESDSDLVALKIYKVCGRRRRKEKLADERLNLMDKTFHIKGARIAFRIWDVGGDRRSLDQVPIACKDAVAILYMFDLTSRCTLNNVVGWYEEARKWNQTAIPILIGTKFDDFVQLPPDIQWTIITQARAYARAMQATLFFSSATHNINVNKIFKFIMAKLFNLPWTPQRNLTIGEPIIDF